MRPAFDRNRPIARVETDHDPRREPPCRLADELRIAHRRGADNHAIDPFAEPGLDRGEVADTAAELHRDRRGFKDALDRRRVDRLARKGAVEVNHVQEREALLLEG